MSLSEPVKGPFKALGKPVLQGSITSAQSLLWLSLISIVWVTLYLPNLGTPVFSGMEGLRYSIATEMVKHKDWVQLYFNGEPYFNKPPLTIWMIAPGIRDLDEINEFAIRLPFALSMLGMAFFVFAYARRWVSLERAAIVALLPMTSIGALRFGRACEIDGILSVLYLLAVVVWSDAWLSRRRSTWSTLLLGTLIGLGCLAKGPLILALFALFFAMVLLHGRSWRELPWRALIIGLAFPLAWVAALFAQGHGHEASGTWVNQIGMRFVKGEISPLVPPHQVQVVWGISLTMPWACLFPILYYPGFLPRGRRIGALLRGGRDAGLVSFIGILAWPGLQYQYLAPVSLLMALEIGAVVVVAGRASAAQLSLGLRILTVVLTALLATVSVVAVLFMSSPYGIGAAGVGLAACVGLMRASLKTGNPSREMSYALAAMIGAAGIAILCILPPLSAVDQDRQIGMEVSSDVPAHAPIYCPLSIDNLAAYTKRHVVIWPPDKPADHLYAIIRDGDLNYLTHTDGVQVQTIYTFQYFIGWRRDQADLHLVLLTRNGAAALKPWSETLAPIAKS
jgi:4-amino-4-deoxy-L-arabinose transferase-like glycosyltransferase